MTELLANRNDRPDRHPQASPWPFTRSRRPSPRYGRPYKRSSRRILVRPFLCLTSSPLPFPCPSPLPSYFPRSHSFYLASPLISLPAAPAPFNSLDFVSSDAGASYNLCHFWSNFEIGDMEWYRGEVYSRFFEWLDRAGGFYYEVS